MGPVTDVGQNGNWRKPRVKAVGTFLRSFYCGPELSGILSDVM